MIEHLNPEGLSTPLGFSHVTVSGPGTLVHVAGQVAKTADGRIVGADDLTAQTEQVYANLSVALAAAGASLRDLVKVTIFVVDLNSERAALVRAVRDRLFSGGPYPASTLIGVSSLAAPTCSSRSRRWRS